MRIPTSGHFSNRIAATRFSFDMQSILQENTWLTFDSLQTCFLQLLEILTTQAVTLFNIL
jgi:hypothetical protein